MKSFYLFLLFIFPSLLQAQENTRLNIRVIVFEQHWKFDLTIPKWIDSTKITLINRRTSDTTIIFTGENGYCRLDSIPEEGYYLKAEKEGYQSSCYYPVKAGTGPFIISLIPSIDRSSLKDVQREGALVINVCEFKQVTEYNPRPEPATRIKDAKVTVTNRETSENFIIYTTDQDSVLLENLPPGNYLVSVEKDGYQPSGYYPVIANIESPLSICLVRSISH